ncbi:phosphate ABC transporter substrate-binding protein PstS [Streptomyces sp. NPDC007861]|uniref:phosphate ABC transporter substrate-binding protein PstS n=1 Tax=Streptomyces sp. NPDC007861 TaxID=3154893 RepID=UPI0033D2D9F5
MTLLEGDPRSVGGYRLEGRLGAGGMGVVFLARSVSGRRLAIKVIRPELATDDGFRVRFGREVEAARQVSGAFTAPVVDADADAEQPWLATLFIPGPSLHQRVAAKGPLPADEVRLLAAGLVEALRDIHRVGLVHRDLKPGNVLLADDGPRVIDFGIARAIAADPLTRTGMVVGTPAFMAPEQFRTGGVGPAGDVFALGAVLVYAATGHGPFDGESTHGIGFRVVYEEPDLTGLAQELLPLVEPCLAKDPGARPTVEGLLAALSVAPVETQSPPAPTEVERPSAPADTQSPSAPATQPAHPEPAVPAAPPAPLASQATVGVATLALRPDAPGREPSAPASQQPSASEPPSASELPSASEPTPPFEPPTPPSPPGRAPRRIALAAAAAVVTASVAALVPLLADKYGGPDGGKEGRNGGSSSASAPAAEFSCAGAQGTLLGSGSSAVDPAMEEWAAGFQTACPGATVTYEAVGSGAGFEAFRSGSTGFAASDTPLDPEKVVQSKARCDAGGDGRAVAVPLAATPVSVAYNLPGVSDLVLDAPTLAKIFDGRISRWDDAAIKALNPGVPLPSLSVRAIHRSDATNTTRVFTNYLKSVSGEWPHEAGTEWPLPSGESVSGNARLREQVAATAGSLGYIDLAGAAELDTVLLDTGADRPVAADAAGATKALASAQVVGADGDLTLALDLTTRAPGAYPLASVSYGVVCDKGNDPAGLKTLRAFLSYAVSKPAQQSVAAQGYAPLPDALRERVRESVRGLG